MQQHSVFFLSSVRAYTLTDAGESIVGNVGGGLSCTTFGPDPRTSYFGSVVQVSLPAAGCGVPGDSRSASAAAGRVTVASALPVGFGTFRNPEPSSAHQVFRGLLPKVSTCTDKFQRTDCRERWTSGPAS